MSAPSKTPGFHRWLVHFYRVGVFVFLLVMIHRQHVWYVEQKRGALKQLVDVELVKEFFPKAVRVEQEWNPAHGGQSVLSEDDTVLGHVIQTSPESDRVIGFSGPTNTLMAWGRDGKIRGTAVLRSDDTREHLKSVLKDKHFLTQWNGMSREEILAQAEIDAVFRRDADEHGDCGRHFNTVRWRSQQGSVSQ